MKVSRLFCAAVLGTVLAHTAHASDGTRLWSRIWGSPALDEALAVAADTNTVYVAGYAEGPVDGQPHIFWEDLLVTKYAPDGQKQWTRIWGTNGNDRVRGACSDGAGGVLIMGDAANNLNGTTTYVLYTDFVLMNVAPNGSALWTRVWGSSGYDEGEDVCTAPGVIYTAGTVEGLVAPETNYAGLSDVCITRWSSAGVRQWTRMFGTIWNDFASACAADSAGNVYVTGFTEGFLDGNTNMGGQDIFLTKYSSAGVRQWTRVWGTNGTDRGMAVQLDSQGNIYVAGKTDGILDGQPKPGGYDLFVSKFLPDGTKLWTRMIGSPQDECYSDSRCGLLLDNDENIYLASYTSAAVWNYQTNAGWTACLLVKCTPEGMPSWVRLWGSPDTDKAYAIAGIGTNSIFVAGSTYGQFDGQTNAGSYDLLLSSFGFGLGGELSVSSGNPWNNVAIAVSRADSAGLSNGLTPFARSYGAAWETTLTAPPGAEGRVFDRWQVDGADSTTNQSVFIHMATNRSAAAVYISDAFAAAWPLSGPRGAVTSNNQRATYEPGEPPHAPPYGPYRSIWWSYTPQAGGTLVLNTTSGAFDTVLAVYTGDAVSNLTRVAANDDDGSPGGASRVIVANAAPAVTYHIAVDTAESWQAGRCVLEWEFTGNSTSRGAVALNEMLINPQAVSDAFGEWIELRNTTNAAVDCAGWRIVDSSSGAAVLPAALLQPDAFIVLCRNTNEAVNGGVAGGILYDSLNMDNNGDSLWLYDAQTQLVDVVSWSSSTAGRSTEVIDPWQEHPDANGTNWALALTTFGSGDYGTPGAENSNFVPEPAALVVAAAVALVFARRGRMSIRRGERTEGT